MQFLYVLLGLGGQFSSLFASLLRVETQLREQDAKLDRLIEMETIMADKIDTLTEEVSNLKTKFAAYTSAASASLEAKIAEAVAAQKARDEAEDEAERAEQNARLDAAIAGIREISGKLEKDEPIEQPGGEPVFSPSGN